jgi:hypothetical protein
MQEVETQLGKLLRCPWCLMAKDQPNEWSSRREVERDCVEYIFYAVGQD